MKEANETENTRSRGRSVGKRAPVGTRKRAAAGRARAAATRKRPAGTRPHHRTYSKSRARKKSATKLRTYTKKRGRHAGHKPLDLLRQRHARLEQLIGEREAAGER